MSAEAQSVGLGLMPEAVAKINAVFSAYPQINQVILYGSRAKGTQRNGSDVDLTILGEDITLAQLLKIENDLDELLLPYRIDLSLYHHIDNPDLIEHIRRVGKIFYTR
ncbi:MAG: nucleotidyltransferase domain-containing protein [Gallionella sp.]|nr:nucleotidyltransferase domain-containing protein [Gallionella sp.]